MAVIIGVGKPKKATMGPPPFPGAKPKAPGGAAPQIDVAVGMPPKPKAAVPSPAPAAPKPGSMPVGDEPEATPDGDETLQPADVDYSANDLCGSCAHMGEDGSCVKYRFPVEESGHCAAGYEPKQAEASPMDQSHGGEMSEASQDEGA